MSHFVEGNFKTFLVGGTDIPQGSAVKLNAGLLVVATAATDKLLGVVNSIGRANTQMDVHLRSPAGTICVKAGGTIAAGDAVTSNGSGQGVTTTTAGDHILGIAVEAGTTGKFVELVPFLSKV